jgi:hypothetical protein
LQLIAYRLDRLKHSDPKQQQAKAERTAKQPPSKRRLGMRW